MAWLGEGLSSLSSLKGQITNFTKEVLSDGIVNEIDDRSKDLEEAHERCNQLQELLNSKDAEISILRRQNNELQKAVVEFRKTKSNDSRSNGGQEEDGQFFWDPPPASRSRGEAKAQGQTKLLQDQLDQATVKIRDLEAELNRLQKSHPSNVKDDANFKEEGPSQKTELLRAKQDVMNRIIQMGEKGREVERNAKRLQQDELSLVGDFRRAVSKLASTEQYDLIKSALVALESENEQFHGAAEKEKSDSEGFDAEGKGGTAEAELRRRVEDLEAENRSLTQSIEELDRQNSESIERVLSLKEELQKKHHSLQSAYEHLYVEYNQSLSKIQTLEQQPQVDVPKRSVKSQSLDSAVQTAVQSKADKETEVVLSKEDKETEAFVPKEDKETEAYLVDEQKTFVPKEDKETEAYLIDEQKTDSSLSKADKETETDTGSDRLDAELQKVQELLKNTPLEHSDGEEKRDDSLFVQVAQQFVELRWKRDTLERKLTEQSRELREAQEQRYSLQLECEDLQTNVDSLLVELQQLKSCLPSIPEASEERVASLETETESLQQEIRALRRANVEATAELRSIKAFVKDQPGVDVARLEAILESGKGTSTEGQDPEEPLRAAREENTALRRRVDILESELRVSLERCKGLDENIELIEELKLDLENARRELKIAASNGKRMENSLTILQEAKAEVDAENELLVRDKEQLEADLKLLRESAQDGEALDELREALKKTREEKNDLDYDIRNMRNELDGSLEELEINRTQNEKLLLDNERLVKENNKLMDQFSESQNESLDKIELLNTEMILLQQELESCKEELEAATKKLKETQEKLVTLESEHDQLKQETAKVKDVEAEKKEVDGISMQKDLDKSREELDDALKRLRELEEKLLIFENENKRLQAEITKAETLGNENRRLGEEIRAKHEEIIKKEEEIASLGTKMKCSENYIGTLEDESQLLENKITELENVVVDNQNLKKEIEDTHQELELTKKQNEENSTLKELYAKYQNDLERLKTVEEKNQLLENKAAESEIIIAEHQALKKEIEETRQQLELAKKQSEEIDILKELNVKYQNDLESLRNLEDENRRLKVELDKLLVAKKEIAVSTSELLSSENLPAASQLSDEERAQLSNQLADKSKEIESLKATISKDRESALMARETVENLSQLISSKDNELIKMTASYDSLKNERDELIKLVQDKHNESLQYHSEIQRLTVLLNDQTVNLQKLTAERDAITAALQDKEAQLLWAQNELQVIKQRLQNVEETSNYGEHCGIAKHSLLAKQLSTLEEKSKALEAAVIQDQSNIRYMQEQLADAQSKEAAAHKEVERLRNHLVEMEANYNEEALQSEEIQRTIEARLIQAEEKLKNSSTIHTSVSVRANQQIETLQQQLNLIVQQRDDLQNKISAADDKVLSYSASLTNLQLVLEQFQRDKEKDIYAGSEKLRAQLEESYKKQRDLADEINYLKAELVEAKECLLAASRLTDQLEQKTERIEQLNQEVNRLTELVNTADQRIQEANKIGEGKVDKFLVKNLLLGYISSPANDKPSVLRVFANVLDFNETEREKSGLNGSSAKNSWFSSLVNSSPASKDQEASLSSAFIKFLENESQPKPQLPALPISNSPLSRPGHSRQHSSSSTQSSILLSNVTLPTFPEFVPARNTGSILKEVLKDS